MIVSSQRLAQIFVEVSDTLVDEFDAADFLHMLTLRVADLVDACAVGILLADSNGTLQFMAASDEGATAVQVFQVQTKDGPCLQAYRTGKPVINADLRCDPRWPRFAAQATAAGFTSVHAFPLRLHSQMIGALNLLSHHDGVGLDNGDTQVIQALADVAAIGLLQERTISRGEMLADQLQTALNTRIIIEQAKGAIAQARHISVDAAFVILRRHARRDNQKVSVLARTVIDDPAVLAALTNTRPHAGTGADRPGPEQP